MLVTGKYSDPRTLHLPPPELSTANISQTNQSAAAGGPPVQTRLSRSREPWGVHSSW